MQVKDIAKLVEQAIEGVFNFVEVAEAQDFESHQRHKHFVLVEQLLLISICDVKSIVSDVDLTWNVCDDVQDRISFQVALREEADVSVQVRIIESFELLAGILLEQIVIAPTSLVH